MDAKTEKDNHAFMTGWLQMCVTESHGDPSPDQLLEWQPMYCAIFSDARKLVVCADGDTKEVFFDDDHPESPTFDRRNVPNLYRKRRSSAPSVHLKGDSNSVFGSSGSTSGSGLKSFLARRLAFPIIRSRSASKLGAKEKPDSLKPRLAAWRSHESLFSECEESMHVESIDIPLRGMTVVRPVHGSVLSRQHCFQVTTPLETRYFTCSSAEDANNWIAGLKEILYPNRNKQSRLDTSLDVWIFEAKGVAAKKRYYCEIVLDKVLYARTSTKLKADLLFWGEQFSFDDLPCVQVLSIHVFKEHEGKKKRKEKVSFVGFLEVPIETVQANTELEKWFPLTLPGASPKPTPKLGGSTKTDQPCVRVKLKYKTVSILPLACYKELHDYIRHNYLPLCTELEPVLSIKAKDELAQTILKVLQGTNQAKQYLADIILAEVESQENENLTFRGNTLATKSMDTYMKMVGKRYLQETLGHFITTIYDQEGDCEVDPSKLTNGSSLEENKKLLLKLVEEAWGHVLSSYCIFPSDLQEAFSLIRKKCQAQNKDVVMKLISGSVFLRFLCPAILSPSLFHLTQEYPDDRTARRLTLIAKTIQNLANFTRFGAKEEYMASLNDFVEKEMPNMRHFLDAISVEPLDENRNNFDSFVDVGRELALLFELLQEHTKTLKEESLLRLSPLMDILTKIRQRRETVDQDEDLRERSRTSSGIIDKYLIVPTITSPLYADCILSCADDYVSGCSLISHTPVKSRGSLDRRTKGRAQEMKSLRLSGSLPTNMAQVSKENHSDLKRLLSGTVNGGISQELPGVVRSSSYHGRVSRKEILLAKDKGSLKASRLLVPHSASFPEAYDQGKQASRHSLYVDFKQPIFVRGNRMRSSSEGGSVAKRSSAYVKLRTSKSEDKAHTHSNTNGAKLGQSQHSDSTSSTLVRSKVVKSQDRRSFLQERKTSNVEHEDMLDVAQNTMLTPGDSTLETMETSEARAESTADDSASQGASDGSQPDVPRKESPALARRNEFRKARKQKPVHQTSIQSRAPNERSLSLDTNSLSAEIQMANLVQRVTDTVNMDNAQDSGTEVFRANGNSSIRQNEDSMLYVDTGGLAKYPSVTKDKHSDSIVSSCSSGCVDHDHFSDFSWNSCSCSSADETDLTGGHLVSCHRQSLLQRSSGNQARKLDTSLAMDDRKVPEQVETEIRPLEQHDSLETMNSETKALQDELARVRSELQLTRDGYDQQLSKYRSVIEVLRTKLNDTEGKLQRQRREKEEQMKSIIARLMNVESELRKEQNEMQEIVHAKQRIIDVQERRIKSLDAANRRLMMALSQLRNKHSDVNGTLSEQRLDGLDHRQDDDREEQHV